MAGVLDFILENRETRRAAEDFATRSAGIQDLTGRAGVNLEGIPGLFEAETVGGTGLLADPSNLANQVRFASGVEQLPGGGGIGLLADILRDESAGERSQATLEQSEVESQRRRTTSLETAQARIAEDARQFAIDAGIQAPIDAAEATRKQAKEERDRRADLRAEEQNRAERLTRPRLVTNPMPRALAGPDAGATLVDPSKTAGNQLAADIVGNMAGDVNEFLSLIEQFGGEFANQGMVGKMDALRSGLILRASAARQAGAPQAAEMEVNALALPDPNTFGARLNPFDKTRHLSAVGTFGNEVKGNYLSQINADPSIAAIWDVFGPEFLEANDIGPDMLEFIKANRGRVLEN